jgi:hypothetical protein
MILPAVSTTANASTFKYSQDQLNSKFTAEIEFELPQMS